MSFVTDVREVVHSRELLVNLVRRELRSKYKGTALGWAWSLINPLATTAIFTVVFSTVMRVEPPVGVDGLHSYPLFLLCGLLTWNFLTASVQGGQRVLLDNGNLIKKTYFPRRLLVIAHVAAAFVSYAVEMGVLVAVFLVAGVNVLPWVPLVVLLMVLVAVFALGLALLLSVVNVYFRDVAHFVALFMQIWFYATPIIYPIALVQGVQDGDTWASDLPLMTLYGLNPMVAFVESVREMFYEGRLPDAGTVLYAIGVTVVVLWIGNAVFGRLQGRLAEEL
jgi:ABC-type polysaccharide/polyol phosphate export permease